MSRASHGRVEMLADAEAVARAAAAAIERAVLAAVEARGRCDLALAGGSTPRRAYELLAARPLPWPQLHLWFGDERCVPPDHPDSNFGMASAALAAVPIAPASFHRMRGEEPDRERAARDYERELPAALDLLLLGIGPDGHTASLFPGSPAVAETARRVVPVIAPKPPPQRLTITPPVIESAREVLVLAVGAEKADAARRALRDEVEPAACPARLLRGATWLLDRAAAARLGEDVAMRRNA